MENKLKLKYVIALGDILWKYNKSKYNNNKNNAKNNNNEMNA